MEFLSNHIDDVGTGSITTVSLPLTQTPYVSSPITNTSVIRENNSLYVGGSVMDESSLSSAESEYNDDDNEDEDDEHSKYIRAMSEAANVAAQASIMIFDDLQTDHEEERPLRGSRPGKSANKNRSFGVAYERLVEDYFSGTVSVFNEVDFERRFRVSRDIFTRIFHSILNKGLFCQKFDAVGKAGIHPLVRTVACL
jgi:hypothetical protein